METARRNRQSDSSFERSLKTYFVYAKNRLIYCVYWETEDPIFISFLHCHADRCSDLICDLNHFFSDLELNHFLCERFWYDLQIIYEGVILIPDVIFTQHCREVWAIFNVFIMPVDELYWAAIVLRWMNWGHVQSYCNMAIELIG